MEYNGSISFETFAKHADMLTANDYRRLTDDPDFQVFKMRELPLIGWTLLVVQLSATIIFFL